MEARRLEGPADFKNLVDFIDYIDDLDTKIMAASVSDNALFLRLIAEFGIDSRVQDAKRFVAGIGESYSKRQRTATMKLIRNLSEEQPKPEHWNSVAHWLLLTSPSFASENLAWED